MWALSVYPLHLRKGPIFSGPQIKPFICQTDTFKLPDGSTLGAPIDVDCSVKTRVDYVYMSSTTNKFVALTSITSLPADVATTTTSASSSRRRASPVCRRPVDVPMSRPT